MAKSCTCSGWQKMTGNEQRGIWLDPRYYKARHGYEYRYGGPQGPVKLRGR